MRARERCGARHQPAPRRTRALALGLAAFAAVLSASTAPASAGVELRPDLRTIKPAELSLEHSAKKLKLRFSNEVANHGVGPLEITPNPAYTDCDGDGPADDHLALQRIYEDGNGNGYYDSGDTAFTDYPAGCKIYHPAHHHWHLTNFARYKLLREPNGHVVAAATKVSFCLLDTFRLYPSLPGSPPNAQYSPECAEFDTQGLSIGWSDLYSAPLPGQALDVTGLHRGIYCLVSTVDPANHLKETDNHNNTAERRLRLHPHHRRVDSLRGPCRD